MKHPALARVLAVVLVIMCAISLAVGINGFGEAADERDERSAYSDKLDSKLASYDLLYEQLDGSESYDEAAAELEQQQEQHDSDASQHRTDTATYSATRGGYKMGADELWEAKAQVEAAKTQLEEAKAQLAQMESTKEAMSTAAEGCTAAASACSEAANGLSDFITALGNISANSELTDEEKQVAYLAALQSNAAALTAAASAASSGAAAYSAALAALPEEAKSAFSDAAGSAASVPSIDASSLAAMTPEQTAVAVAALQSGLNQLAAGLPQMAAGLASAQSAIDEAAAQALSQMSTSGVTIPDGLSASEIIAYMEQQIADGEKEIQANLELIWYELGQLDEDKAELEEEKTALDAEAAELDALEEAAEALKQLENEYNTTKTSLTNVDGIASRVDAGESIHDASLAYIEEYRAQTEDNYRLSLLIAALTVAAAIAGFAALPAAFEKTKKRFWLIAPALLCLICSAAAEALCIVFARDQHYAAIFTAIFAALYLFAALPREKTLTAE